MREWALFIAAGVTCALAQPADKRPEFEVASIKLLAPGGPTVASITSNPGRIRYHQQPLNLLICRAFGIQPWQLLGLEEKAAAARYEIDATFSGGNTDLMLQVLLERRLGLKVHREMKDTAAYVVTLALGGLRAERVEQSTETPSFAGGPASRLSSFSGAPRTGERTLPGKFTVSDLIRSVAVGLDRPMVDVTGAEGTYEIKFAWKEDSPPPPASYPGAGDGVAATPSGGRGGNLFSEMEKQLGLKVEPKFTPIVRIIVDHVEPEPVVEN